MSDLSDDDDDDEDPVELSETTLDTSVDRDEPEELSEGSFFFPDFEADLVADWRSFEEVPVFAGVTALPFVFGGNFILTCVYSDRDKNFIERAS